MNDAFQLGKVKSFTKSPANKPKSKSEPQQRKLIAIEYQEDSAEGSEEETTSYHIKKVSNNSGDIGQDHIIIEPYDEEIEFDPFPESSNAKNEPNKSSNCMNTSNSSFSGTGMQSNELFLKSLQSSLDRLPDDKNMRARIKIQEVLYNIMYDNDK
jgi:hypothetical protein